MNSPTLAPLSARAIQSPSDAEAHFATDVQDENMGPELERLWLRARELRYWLLGIFACAIVGAVALTLLMTPQYRSTARIEISRIDTAAAGNVEGAAMPAEERDEQYYQTQYELLKSRFLAERVVEAKNLTRDNGFREIMGVADGQLLSTRDAAGFLLASVEITPIKNSNLVDIAVSLSSPEMAADLANAWAQQFLRANYDKRFGDNILSREQLDKQLDEMRARLERSEAELIRYANAHRIIIVQGEKNGEATRSTLLATQLDALSSALADATTRRIAAESGLRAGSDASSIAATAQLRSRLAEADAALAKLRSKLGRDNFQVRELQSEMVSLKRSLATESTTQSRARDGEYRKALMEERELRARFEATKQDYLAQQGQGVQYGILQREVDTSRQIYDALLQRHKELGVASTASNNMTLIESALPASNPYKPSMPLNLLVALGLAAMISAGTVYGREMLDTSIRDPEEMRRQFGLPLIGMIPRTDTQVIQADLADPHSVLSEAYASVRVAVQYAQGGHGLKSLLLTSTRPDEGKTVSSLALAHSFALAGEKILLIDIDLRRAGLTKTLALDTEGGIAALLAGSTDAPRIQHVEKFGLDFIAGGPRIGNPVALLAGNRLRAFLEEMKHRYDRILIDGPPVLGLADAPEISRATDGIVYIVQANSGARGAIRRAMNRLAMSNASMVGAVVTQLDDRNAAYGYGYGYGYGHSYNEERRA